jgi:2-amino-4-hydroxy-6-hydroxymethyldihydropteridine diphosphokinase
LGNLHSACIGLGSNLGDSRNLLMDAWQELADHNDISTKVLSSPYQTPPMGMDSPNWFVNAVGLLETTLVSDALLDVFLELEQRFGRIRSDSNGYQDRTLDLDLLLFEDLIVQTPRLTLPHPAMHERGFVLIPLTEIAPQLLHPGLNKTIQQLLEGLEKTGGREGIERLSWSS